MSRKTHHLSYTATIAALFSVILILSAGLPLLQQQQQRQEAYASSQAQAQAPPSSFTQAQRTSSQAPPPQHPPTPICNPKSPAILQLGSTGAKVAELQRVLAQVGYGSLLLRQAGGDNSGIDGKFGIPTQNAVKKFQQDNRLPVDGKVGQIT